MTKNDIDLQSLVQELIFLFPFLSGENETEQLACIMEVLALPPSSVLEQATRRRLFFGMSWNATTVWKLTVHVRVNQELCYRSLTYGPTAFDWPPLWHGQLRSVRIHKMFHVWKKVCNSYVQYYQKFSDIDAECKLFRFKDFITTNDCCLQFG